MPVLVVDKPTGPTSFLVVKRVERVLRRWARARGLPPPKRIGHGGTLDPLASGVLPVCVDEGTKLAQFLLDADKAYEATLRFGVETDTLDAEGRVVAEHPLDAGGAPLDEARVRGALAGFIGRIEQVPPMYSALKRHGTPLHELARAGEEVERAPRIVTIHELDLRAFEAPDRARVHVRCSKGTYVRTLAADLGRLLGVGAHLVALRRTKSGPFGIEDAVGIDRLEALEERGEPLPWVSLAAVLAHLPAVTVADALAQAIRDGKKLPWASLEAPGPARVRVLRTDGSLLAVAEPGEGDRIELLRVFNPEPLGVTS